MRNDQSHYTMQFDVAEGKMPEFETLAQEACDLTKASEPGTLVYRWQIDPSGTRVQLHERFADEAALVAHANGAAASTIFPKLLDISELTRFDVHGNPGADATEVLTGSGATIFKKWKGFDL